MKRILSLWLAALMALEPVCCTWAGEGAAGEGGAGGATSEASKGGDAETTKRTQDLAAYLAKTIGSLGGAILPDSFADWLQGKLDKYAEKGTEAAKKALIKEVCEKLPGDASKDAFKTLFEHWDGKADQKTIEADIDNLVKNSIRDGVEQAIIKAGLGPDEAKAIRKTVEDLLAQDNGKISDIVGGNIRDYLHDKLEHEVGKDTADEVFKLYDKLKDDKTWETEDGWDELMDQVGATAEAITFDMLTHLVDDQIEKWGKQYPEVKKWLDALGINGAFVSGEAKTIWNIVKGEGTWEQKFTALAEHTSEVLNQLAWKAVNYGLQQLKGWVSKIAQKWCKKALDWLAGKLEEWLGRKIPASALKLFQKGLDKLSQKAGQYVVDLGSKAAEKILGPDPEKEKQKQGEAGAPAASSAGQGGHQTLLQGEGKKKQ